MNSKYSKKVLLIIQKVKEFLKKHQYTIGVGAATKGNTLLNCCEITDKDLKFIVDKSKHKINKFAPGTGIKIIKETNNTNARLCIDITLEYNKISYKKNFLKN